MAELPLYFSRNGTRLFGMLHLPGIPAKDRGFVFCSPLFEEKLWAHRVFVNFARLLCGCGYHVLRFDYTGNGDSDGDFHEGTTDTYVADIMEAVLELKKIKTIKSVGLLGLRFGGTLAMLTALAPASRVDMLILWEPILDGKAYARELLRINLATQSAVFKKINENTRTLVERMKSGSTVNVDGYELSWPLYSGIEAVNFVRDKVIFPGNTLIAGIDRKSAEPFKLLGRITHSSGTCDTVSVLEDHFWKELPRFYSRAENLSSATLEWLGQI